MNPIADENYNIYRTLLQINYERPDRGFLNKPFIHNVIGPMMGSPKLFRIDADIHIAARAWADPETRAAAVITYGHISDWDTSHVTDMAGLFNGWIHNRDKGDSNMILFNDDISRWDTSNVTTMYRMFNNARVFNGDLSRWDTSKVINMESMFMNCPLETKHKPPRCR